jgi:hypothetical protein
MQKTTKIDERFKQKISSSKTPKGTIRVNGSWQGCKESSHIIYSYGSAKLHKSMQEIWQLIQNYPLLLKINPKDILHIMK